jgi:hypothetical protein
VVKEEGSAIGHLTAPDLFEAKSVTVCMRSYQRWDPASAIPDAGEATANSQYKIMTIGGLAPNNGHNPFQLGVNQGGGIYTRSDSAWYDCSVPPFWANVGQMQECQNNYCRFELCLDLPASGLLTARYRRTILAPSPQAGEVSVVVKPQCINARNEIDLQGGYNWVFDSYGQNLPGPSIRYFSHAIMAKHRPADPSFWPGPAYEIEGGGGPPPEKPLPPMLLE